MADFTLKRGDTRPILISTLTDNGTAVDLTNATAVKLKVRQVGGSSLIVDSNCTFVNRPNGQISYTWGTADTSAAGTYEFEYEITWNDGGIETHPNNGFLTLDIMPDMRQGQVGLAGPLTAVPDQEPARTVGWQKLA